MDYYKLLGLQKEPFSNTPDPEFFYRVEKHVHCLQKLEIAIRLRRGLCLVRGGVGTGKTTLCRQLIRILGSDDCIELHLILDPGFEQAQDLAGTLNAMLGSREQAMSCSTLSEHKEMIKNRLFGLGAEQQKIVVLIIDEGQKLSSGCIELLRELLNYETNQYKLLQIVIFAQDEIQNLLAAQANFIDRVALEQHLEPLSRKDTVSLIRYRLQQAGGLDGKGFALAFTPRAWERIYALTQGYPRKIVHLLQHILLLLLIKGRFKVTAGIVEQAAENVPGTGFESKSKRKAGVAGFVASAALLILLALIAYGWQLSWPWPESSPQDPGQRSGAESRILKRPVTGINQLQFWPLNTAKLELPVVSPASPAKNIPEGEQAGPLTSKAKKPACQGSVNQRIENLGRVKIQQNDHLWRMLQRIYGKADLHILGLVQEANPEIKDLDLLEAGQSIVLPALAGRPVQESGVYWLQYQSWQDLNQAHEYVFQQKDPELRILSYWIPNAGLRHAVVSSRSFSQRGQAESALQDLGQEIANSARILDLSQDKLCLPVPGKVE